MYDDWVAFLYMLVGGCMAGLGVGRLLLTTLRILVGGFLSDNGMDGWFCVFGGLMIVCIIRIRK